MTLYVVSKHIDQRPKWIINVSFINPALNSVNKASPLNIRLFDISNGVVEILHGK